MVVYFDFQVDIFFLFLIFLNCVTILHDIFPIKGKDKTQDMVKCQALAFFFQKLFLHLPGCVQIEGAALLQTRTKIVIILKHVCRKCFQQFR